MGKKIGFGVFALFWIVIGLTVYGFYKYLEWLFSQELLTTAGIVGIITIIPLSILACLWIIFCITGLKAGIEEAKR